MLMKKMLLLVATTLLIASCSENPAVQPKNLNFSAVEQQMVQQCNDFSFNMLAQVAQKDEKENIVLSPLSASMLLGMLMNGADGQTLAQIQEVTGFGTEMSVDAINNYYRQLIDVLPALDQYSKISIVNGIWAREDFPVCDTFVLACKQNFDAPVKNVPTFSSDQVLADINGFAAQHTNNRIKEIINPNMVTDETVMILLNALYFKALWDEKFKKEYTLSQNFTTLNGTQIQADMMSRSGDVLYGETEDYQMIELPYKGDKYCADILLPAKGQGIRIWLSMLNDERWQKMLKEMSKAEVNLSLPKFSLSYERELSEDLQALGMTDAFNLSADFSRLSKKGAYISFFMQKSFMQVDEEGSEAAAVTATGITVTSMPSLYNFIADRPFLFVIREKEYGTILFTALIGHPEWKE